MKISARETDMPDEQYFYNLKHRVENLESSGERLEKKFSNEHQTLKDTVAKLAESHEKLATAIQQQSVTFAKFESSVESVIGFIKWQVPVLVSIIGLVLAIVVFIVK